MTDAGYTLSTRSSRIRANEVDFIYLPNKVKPGSHPFFHFHGANSAYGFGYGSSYAEGMLGAVLATNGIVCIGGAMGGNTFGNNLSQTLIDSMFTVASGITGVDASKAHMAGASMGNAPQFRYAANNPTKVKSLLGLIPYSDPVAVRNENRRGLKTTIEAAWGIGSGDPLPAQALLKETHAPLIAAANIPYLAFYASDDTAALPAEVTALASLANGTAISVGALGHTNMALYAAALHGVGGITGDGSQIWKHYIDWSGILDG